MRLLAATVVLITFATSAFAQTPGACDLGAADRNLDVSRVYAKLFNTGGLFYGGTTTNGDGYLVPIQAAASPLFAASLWVGGFIDGDLRMAGSTYQRFEFWPGPLNEGAVLPDSDDCSTFDRIWLVSAEDVVRYGETGEATDDLAAWPVGLGADAVDASGEPVVPTSREQVVDLEAGERPVVFGSQTAFWVMNDVGNEHERTRTDPIGLEVQVTAFAVAGDEDALSTGTFYRYRLVNRNTQPLEEARFGFFMDTDLGAAYDDYVGVDTTRSLAFIYNEAEINPIYGVPPAFGVDFLNGLTAFNVPLNSPSEPVDDPGDGIAMYNRLLGLWNDGTPITEGGTGYQTAGDTTVFFYPGDPVTSQFWSEENASQGHPNPSGDRRSISASPAFTLAPGETRDLHLALVFAQGTDRLDSITELRAASDLIQSAYDDGSLFDTVLPDPPIVLAAPDLLAPAEGATIVDVNPRLEWEVIAGAAYYRVEVSRNADFAEREVFFTAEPSFEVPLRYLSEGALTGYRWRVRAGDEADGISPFSEVRSFTFYRYVFDGFGSGVGIVETANPNTLPCPDADDPGCDRYGGNTVWLDPNTTDDYVLANTNDDILSPFGLVRYPDAIDGDDFEMRFTDACATAGACLGIYASAAPDGNDFIASVPFELWNSGDEQDGTVRMIPFLRPPRDQKPIEEWSDTFTDERDIVLNDDTLTLAVTHRILWMMPDRPDGYNRFAAAAAGFGGPGSFYAPETDGDMQEETYTDPDTGETSPCRSQGYYVDFCYLNTDDRFVAPLGGLDGMQIADLAGDGTTPPVGTVIRFDANERLLTDADDDEVPAQPGTFSLDAAYPNPFRTESVVPFVIGQAAHVRLSVYDVLGREVAVLREAPLPAGRHRAVIDGSRLATGVYVVVLNADGRQQAQKVLLVR